jgi:uncharacterized repeat protein (TIGR01451 family)
MTDSRHFDWKPALVAIAGVLLVVVLALAPRAQAGSQRFQTIPTPTERTTLPPDDDTPVPPGRTSTPAPPGPGDTPTPPGPGSTPLPGATLPPGAASPNAGGGTLVVHKDVSRQDVLPGETIQFRLLLSNTGGGPVTGILLTDHLEPSLELQRVSATQGAADVQDSSLVLRMGILEAGQTALVQLDIRVADEAQPGQILLNQAIAYFDGGEVHSEVVALGLPPALLPATGSDRRGP